MSACRKRSKGREKKKDTEKGSLCSFVPFSSDKNKKFAYIEYPTEVNGKEIILKLAIKKSPQKNKFWVHSVYTTKKVSDSPASTDIGTEAGHITADEEIVSQNSKDVNTESKNLLFIQKAIRNIFQKNFVGGIDFFEDFCYTDIDRARLLGNAVFGIPSAQDLCLFYFVLTNSYKSAILYIDLVFGTVS